MFAEIEGDGDFLGVGVAGDDGGGDVGAVFRTEALDEFVVFRLDADHRHRQADDAGGGDADFRALQFERLGDGIAHRVGVVDALDAGAGVGVAGVGDDGAEVALAEMRLGNADGRGLDAVGGEGAGGGARAFPSR